MTKTLVVGFLAVLVGTLGCKEKKRKGGLPPATEWQADKNNNDPNTQTTQNPPNVPNHPGNDPHAGLGIPNPYASGGGADPHAGLNMGGKGDTPHTGGEMRIPSRTGHPDRTLAGTLVLPKNVKVPPGAWLFIYAKTLDPKTNTPGGTIVVKVDHNPKFPYTFTIDESNAMSGLPLTGTVMFEARLDGDKNASSRQKGDVLGRIKVKVPNKKLKVAMDTVLKADVQVGGM